MTGTFNYEKDSDNIVTVTMDMSGPVNAMNDEYVALMGETIDRLEAERESIAGVVLTSAKSSFFAGGDIKSMLSLKPGEGEAEMFEMNLKIKGMLRRMEKLGRPVVAAINGAALGGGCTRQQGRASGSAGSEPGSAAWRWRYRAHGEQVWC